ncbi:MAG: cardiolipin synthase, partial [Prosthecobacter sp.]
WGYIVALISIFGSLAALTHILLRHRDHRSASFWAALVVLSPLVAPILYLFLGINILRRRGRRYRQDHFEPWHDPVPANPLLFHPASDEARDHQQLAVTLDKISRFCFVHGNNVRPLQNGDQAMPLMLGAIRTAKTSISIASYIFEASGIGSEFVTELTAAVKRGVEVRVMVDDAGTRYSWPSIVDALQEAGVQARRFMPNHFLLRLITMNLRNHRKIMVVDGSKAFTGGMNIREGNMLSLHPKHPVQDLHFEITGPIVAQIQRVFVEDWAFCAGEMLDGPKWFPPFDGNGPATAIGIVDGPDEDMEVMPAAFFAAINGAKQEILIATPYFLPTAVLLAALRLAAIRGVKVRILTPRDNNILFVKWAAQTLYPQLLQVGCRIFESTPPFDHTKIFVVDGIWSFIGSTNWDPRSLRLNFEFNVAFYDRELASCLREIFHQKRSASQEVTREALGSATLTQQLRNGFAKLFIPLL